MSLWESRAHEIKQMLDEGKDYRYIANHYQVSRKTVKNRVAELRHKGLFETGAQVPINGEVGYKESVEIFHDGTHKSDKLLRMSAEESKDPEYLLKAHGYDIDAWELLSARSNIWNVYSTADGVQTLYASKITVKPKANGWTFDQLLDVIREVEPVHIEKHCCLTNELQMLEVPIFDAHFGISDYEYYKTTQKKIHDIITSQGWEQILFPIGQDAFHNDNFRGQTANGTAIETVDIPQAWRDATRFYEPLIEAAVQHSNYVKVMYIKANHDESLSWAFVQYLKARFPTCDFDDDVQERKVHTFGSNFIGITHGDKARKQLHNIFPVEFPLQWANAKNREIHVGHLHVEDAKDNFGMMIRTLATRNKTDAWHRDNGYVGAHKRFMLFEFSLDALECIHYV